MQHEHGQHAVGFSHVERALQGARSAEAAVRAEARMLLRVLHTGYSAGAVGAAHGVGELLGFRLVLCGAVPPRLEQRRGEG